MSNAQERDLSEEEKRRRALRFAENLTSLEGIVDLRKGEQAEDVVAQRAANLIKEDNVQATGAVLSQTDSGQRNLAKAAEALPENVRRTVVEEIKNPDKVVQSVAGSKQSKLQGTDGSIKDNFMDAVTFFLPTAIGALVGGAFEGAEGAVAGAETATSLGTAFREHGLRREALEQKQARVLQPKLKKFQQTEFVDKKGDPLTFDPERNEYIKADGTLAKSGDFRDPIDARQAKNIKLRTKQLNISQVRLDHQITKDTQLSDKQVDKLESLTTVIDSIDRIDTLSAEVATGLGRGQFQSLLEFADAAPTEFTALKAETSSALASYVKSISGAQVSELEAQRLSRILPNVDDAPNVFEAKLKTFRGIVKANKRAFKRAILTGQPLKKGTILGLDKAEKEVSDLKPGEETAAQRIEAMSPEKRKRFEEFKARRGR